MAENLQASEIAAELVLVQVGTKPVTDVLVMGETLPMEASPVTNAHIFLIRPHEVLNRCAAEAVTIVEQPNEVASSLIEGEPFYDFALGLAKGYFVDALVALYLIADFTTANTNAVRGLRCVKSFAEFEIRDRGFCETTCGGFRQHGKGGGIENLGSH
jgi:hypothetical protein